MLRRLEAILGQAREQLSEAMRWLLLPVPILEEEGAVDAAVEALKGQGIDLKDARAWITIKLEEWRSAGLPDPGLEAVVAAYVEAGDTRFGPMLGRKYFKLHARLAGMPGVGHDAASAVLSHTRLIARLAADESLSSAQVAKVVSTRDRRAPVSWQQVKLILGELELMPSLNLSDVREAYEADEALEVDLFADAEQDECLRMAAEIGRRLGFPGDLLAPLTLLLPPDEVPYGPYLQMLHFQCTVAEHYDHALASIYEFNPRGQAPDWLFAQYPAALEVAGNPFLNNAKSVDDLSVEWARSKKPAQAQQAFALVAIIQGLDSMGFSARRELAAWLRRLLLRRIRIARGYEIELPSRLRLRQINALFSAVAASETGTRGILEQRLVDAVASLRHPSPMWLARGLLDSVNATNVSRRKCGDCDFQNAATARVVAYEAHAGRLTDIYLQGHLRTLEAVLRERSIEWEENVGSGLEWQVIVTFIAHELDVSELPERKIGEAAVRVEATDYITFLSGVDSGSAEVADAIDAYVRAPLAASRTPGSIREALLRIVGEG
jgi:hypothetical protein